MEVLEDRCLLATLIWDGTSGRNWNAIDPDTLDTNWRDQETGSSRIPQDGDTLIFPNDVTVTNRSSVNNTTSGNTYTIEFQGSGYTIQTGSNAINLVAGGITDSSTGATNTLGAPLTIGGTSTPINVSDAAHTLEITGAISGTNTASMVSKTGPGTLRYSGTNSFAGTTSVMDGALELNSPTNLTGNPAGIPGRLVIGDGFGEPNSAVVRRISNLPQLGSLVTINSDGEYDGSTAPARTPPDVLPGLTINGGTAIPNSQGLTIAPGGSLTMTGGVIASKNSGPLQLSVGSRPARTSWVAP